MTDSGRNYPPTIHTDHHMQIRPTISTVQNNPGISEEELFQNTSIRPIIKGLHNLLIAYLKEYIEAKNLTFNEWPQEKKVKFLTTAFQKDHQLVNNLKGMVIGHFTVEEYTHYTQLQNNVRKRIPQIIKERVISSMDELNH